MFELDKLLRNIYSGLESWFVSNGISTIWLNLGVMLFAAAFILAALLTLTLFLVWWERKVSAHIQDRLGPMRTGPHGVLQTIADTVKLMEKEDTIPASADRRVFFWAPVIAFAAAFLAYIVILPYLQSQGNRMDWRRLAPAGAYHMYTQQH